MQTQGAGDLPWGSYLIIMTSSGAAFSSVTGKRWMVTEFTILPPNLCRSNSGHGRLVEWRVDDKPSVGLSGVNSREDRDGSRSTGKALSTSDGRSEGFTS